jgi:2-polyprenyl-3-methyl-5-hydroxy-6-metoxy-1,4-benzoquinol methylase
MTITQRSYEKELLDKNDIPFEDIKKNMEELDVINKWLGGHAITVRGLRQLIQKRKSFTVCEIGCGGGDNLVAIVKWCQKRNIRVKCTGIDIKNECLAFAKRNKLLTGHVKWICNDYKDVQFQSKPDIIFSSLFCHHFPEEELTQQVKWMKDHSALGFFINDLQRNIVAYYSIKLLTRLFSKSYLVRNDAPLSVARGLIRKEWRKVFEDAGIKDFDIRWQWAYRYLIVSSNDRR